MADMRYRRLGESGLAVSVVGIGCNNFGRKLDAAGVAAVVDTAIDCGITLFDTADVYGVPHGASEQLLGAALIANRRRDDVVIATKFGSPMDGLLGPDWDARGARRYVMRAVEASMRRLGVDHVDLYQIHRPDPSTPIEETVGALDDLVRAGKIRYWGTSTFPADEIVEARWAAQRRGATGPHTEQPPYSILCRHIERDVLPACRRHGIGVLVWSPLSGGWLTGKYRAAGDVPDGSRAATNPDHFDGDNEAKAAAVDRLRGIAAEAGLPIAHLSLAWAAEHPAVSSVLLGPRTEEQLADLLGAADINLDAATLDAIDAVVAPGTDLNPADAGWTPPGLAARQRRRNMPETVRSYAPPDDGDTAGGDT
jgi:aryl-alcohol dehydrogenase (NADP+)